MTGIRDAGCLLLALGLVAGCGGAKKESGSTDTSSTTPATVTLTDRLLRPGELPGTTRTSPPEVHTSPSKPLWTGSALGFVVTAKALRAAGFRAGATERLPRPNSLDYADSSVLRFSSPSSARREADAVVAHQRHYAADPLFDVVRVHERSLPGVPGGRVVDLALSSRSDKTAFDRAYVVVIADGPFLETVFTNSTSDGAEGAFPGDDVLAAAKSLYDRTHLAASSP